MMASRRNYLTASDLNKLKALAHALLNLDIQFTKLSPLVVQHPFTDSGIVGLRKKDGSMAMADLINDSISFQAWREQVGKMIDNVDKPINLFQMITKPYKLGFLKFAAPFLSEQDMALFLSQAWIITESPNSDPNLSKQDLLALFRSIDPQILMNTDEYRIFCGLDNVVTVYRGVTSHNAKNVKALSWTLDKNTAEWFAHRYGEQGTIYEAQISKEYIYAIFLSRNEAEVIIDPKHLMGISKVQVQQQRQKPEQNAPIVGRVSFANGEQIEYTAPAEYLKLIREELPYHATTGFRFETLTSDPEIRKAADDTLYDLYGEENPRCLADYQEQSNTGITMGGMQL